jgi:hypothetical protein
MIDFTVRIIWHVLEKGKGREKEERGKGEGREREGEGKGKEREGGK